MENRPCNQCGSNYFDSDSTNGATICTKCGIVIQEDFIVNELHFEDGNHGSTNLIGRMVSNNTSYKSRGASIIGNNLSMINRESREITLENARRQIEGIGKQLKLNQHSITTAFNFYKMALSRQLTGGRRKENVYAACIYITCRIEGTSHMLIDLSDAVLVNIFELGKTYRKLSDALCINIPLIDPCIYIMRFANRLHKLIGTDANKISVIEATALRIVQRMKRDWISIGRRPSGLCGAALLMACRLNEIHCDIRDITQIVQMGDTTIRKRLTEFGNTQTGHLTLDEFENIDLESEDDPPCYKEDRKRLRLMSQQVESNDQFKNLESELAKFQKMIDGELESIRTKKTKSYASILDDDASADDVITEDNVVDKIIEDATTDVLTRVLNDKDTSKTVLEKLGEFRPTAKSLGLTNRPSGLEIALIDNNPSRKDDEGELDLTGIDDDEIDSYILNEEERLAKEELWLRVHGEYIEELERKAEKETTMHPKVERKQTKRKRAPCVATTANEAVETMLQEKRISSKINYTVLYEIMTTDLTESPLNNIDIN